MLNLIMIVRFLLLDCDYSALRIDFCLYIRLAEEGHNPFLCALEIAAQELGNVLDSDFSENPAVCLEVDELDVFEQNVLVRCQEEIALDFCADLLYEFLCGVKIEIDQQLFEKLCEGVFVIKAVLGQKVQYKLPIFVIELVILGEKNHANQVFDHVGAEQLHRRQVLVHGEASLKHVVKILLVHPETEDQVENYMDDECLVLQNVRRVLPEEFLVINSFSDIPESILDFLHSVR